VRSCLGQNLLKSVRLAAAQECEQRAFILC